LDVKVDKEQKTGKEEGEDEEGEEKRAKYASGAHNSAQQIGFTVFFVTKLSVCLCLSAIFVMVEEGTVPFVKFRRALALTISIAIGFLIYWLKREKKIFFFSAETGFVWIAWFISELAVGTGFFDCNSLQTEYKSEDETTYSLYDASFTLLAHLVLVSLSFRCLMDWILQQKSSIQLLVTVMMKEHPGLPQLPLAPKNASLCTILKTSKEYKCWERGLVKYAKKLTFYWILFMLWFLAAPRAPICGVPEKYVGIFCSSLLFFALSSWIQIYYFLATTVYGECSKNMAHTSVLRGRMQITDCFSILLQTIWTLYIPFWWAGSIILYICLALLQLALYCRAWRSLNHSITTKYSTVEVKTTV
jgi:hypothetical protein